MANAKGLLHPIKGSRDRGVEWLFGNITVGASGAVSATDANGFTVTKEAAAGTYTVVLDESCSRVLWADAALELQTPTDQFINLQDASIGTTGATFEVFDVSGAAVANLASGDKVHFVLAVSRSGLPRKGLGTS